MWKRFSALAIFPQRNIEVKFGDFRDRLEFQSCESHKEHSSGGFLSPRIVLHGNSLPAVSILCKTLPLEKLECVVKLQLCQIKFSDECIRLLLHYLSSPGCPVHILLLGGSLSVAKKEVDDIIKTIRSSEIIRSIRFLSLLEGKFTKQSTFVFQQLFEKCRGVQDVFSSDKSSPCFTKRFFLLNSEFSSYCDEGLYHHTNTPSVLHLSSCGTLSRLQTIEIETKTSGAALNFMIFQIFCIVEAKIILFNRLRLYVKSEIVPSNLISAISLKLIVAKLRKRSNLKIFSDGSGILNRKLLRFLKILHPGAQISL